MNIMCVERRRDHRRRSLPGPHSFVSKDTPKAQCVKFYGIPDRSREFWCRGYYVDTTGKNTKAIKEYIAKQLKVDQEMDQLVLFDPKDPFTGSH